MSEPVPEGTPSVPLSSAEHGKKRRDGAQATRVGKPSFCNRWFLKWLLSTGGWALGLVGNVNSAPAGGTPVAEWSLGIGNGETDETVATQNSFSAGSAGC